MKRALLLVAACAPPAPPPCADPTPDPSISTDVAPGTAAVFWSSESAPFDLNAPTRTWFQCPRPIAHAFERRPDLAWTAADASPAIVIDPTTTYQTILGIGISMERASVANLLALSPAKQDEVLTRMFDPVRGMGVSLVRVTIGTSDFTDLPWYTYEDTQGAFSVQRDIDLGIVGVLQRIRAIAPDVTMFASPWSPPAWMKTTGTITGGALRSDAIPDLAAYYHQFVVAYRDLGLPIAAMTLQNEPRADNPAMPSCFVTGAQEGALAKAVKAEFTAAGLPTAVWIYDHNFDAALDYASDALADPDARAASDGVAFHDYAGEPAAIAAVQAAFPEQQMLFTEKTLWGIAGVERATAYFRSGATSYASWVAMLDQDGQPNAGPNTDKPRRFIRSLSSDDYWATPEHFLFGMFSRLVRPGARRIASSEAVAFLNSDGTIVAVVTNPYSHPIAFVLRSEGQQIAATLEPGTAGAYVWACTSCR